LQFTFFLKLADNQHGFLLSEAHSLQAPILIAAPLFILPFCFVSSPFFSCRGQPTPSPSPLSPRLVGAPPPAFRGFFLVPYHFYLFFTLLRVERDNPVFLLADRRDVG